jgi:hypothetical protein
VIDEIGRFSRQCLPVTAEGGNNGLDALLAKLARAAFNASVEQLLGVGRPGGFTAPRANQPRQARQHVVELGCSGHSGFPAPCQ